MPLLIEELYFPTHEDPAKDQYLKIHGRGITEDEVLRALSAESEGDGHQLLVREQTLNQWGQPEIDALCQDPVSGKYLEVAFSIEDEDVARCFHAREMTVAERRSFREYHRI